MFEKLKRELYLEKTAKSIWPGGDWLNGETVVDRHMKHTGIGGVLGAAAGAALGHREGDTAQDTAKDGVLGGALGALAGSVGAEFTEENWKHLGRLSNQRNELLKTKIHPWRRKATAAHQAKIDAHALLIDAGRSAYIKRGLTGLGGLGLAGGLAHWAASPKTQETPTE